MGSAGRPFTPSRGMAGGRTAPNRTAPLEHAPSWMRVRDDERTSLSAALLNGCRPLDGGCSAHCCRCRCSMTSGVVVEQLFAPDPVTTDGTCARMHHPHVGRSLRDSQPFI